MPQSEARSWSENNAHNLAFRQRIRPIVMGILNATPDSFSDGGKNRTPSDGVAQAELMIANGVDLLARHRRRSTRPGADPVVLQEDCGVP